MREELVAAIVCAEYGWTWEEYMSQPSWFIDVIVEKYKADATQEKKKK